MNTFKFLFWPSVTGVTNANAFKNKMHLANDDQMPYCVKIISLFEIEERCTSAGVPRNAELTSEMDTALWERGVGVKGYDCLKVIRRLR